MNFTLLSASGAASVLASSVPTITPAEFGGGTSAHFIWTLMADPQVVALVLSGLGGLTGIILRHRRVKQWRLQKAVEFLASGVRETYEEYVRETKKGHADGKLTTDERDLAMQKTIAKAKEYCRENGFDLFKVYAKEFVPVIVERIIGTQKAFGRANVPFPPLPELEPR